MCEIMKKLLATVFLALSLSLAVEATASAAVFPLYKAAIWYDSSDTPLAGKVAGMFADDIARVSGRRPEVITGRQRRPCMVVLGTAGHCSLAPDIPGLEGRWEAYGYEVSSRTLNIIGSDPRGMAYGVFDISSKIGVSPWYWWADVPAKHDRKVSVEIQNGIHPGPSVKYRGIFINDEDWGLLPWASKTFEPETGNIGPKTYAKVCELLLRLKANTLMPAMHNGSAPFYSIPENKEVAASYGIVVTTSHCEPLLYNNAAEWDTSKEWNYITNKAGIDAVLESRVKEAAAYENIWQLGMRGIHDREIVGAKGLGEKAAVLNSAIRSQREMLSRILGKPAELIPQSFTPYKEVLDILESGLLELPEDVTIVWPDDNFGYFKRLSGSLEAGRSGRSGVYYHISYLGPPHAYLWFSTTPTVLMYEELSKAYRTGADRYWILNSGDIKACEMQMDFGLRLAWDLDAFDYDSAADFPVEWYCSIFGEEHREKIADIVESHRRLSFVRKPEFMSWSTWLDMSRKVHDEITDTEFSFVNYNEAQDRLDGYARISELVKKMTGSIPEALRPAWFELLEYQIRGAELYNRINLKAQQYNEYLWAGRSAAAELRQETMDAYDEFERLKEEYWSLLGGKWRYVICSNREMDLRRIPKALHGIFLQRRNLPECRAASGEAVLGVQAEGESGFSCMHELEGFSVRSKGSHWIDIFNKGGEDLNWTAVASEPWVRLSSSSGSVRLQERINVDIDWDALGQEGLHPACITISGAGKDETVAVTADNRTAPCRNAEANGWLRIDATSYDRTGGPQASSIKVLKGLGTNDRVLQFGDALSQHAENFRGDENTTRAEYDFWCFNRGFVDVYVSALPTFPVNADREFTSSCTTQEGTRYSVAIDEPSYENGRAYGEGSTSAPEFSAEWKRAALCNQRVCCSRLYIDKPGRHTLVLRMGDPGLMFDHITIDFGGLKKCYVK